MDQRQWVEGIIKKYSRALIRYAQNILKDFEVACEVVQECYIKLMGQDQVTTKILGWLYREVRNRSIDIWRRQRKQEPLSIEKENDLSSDHPNPLEGLEARENMQHLLKAIQTLSARDQEILTLKYTEGLSYQEIAEVMGLTATNVGYILCQAVKSIRDDVLSARDARIMEKKYGE
ncbi:MAG: RNA polymerase sigma factor [Bdellovibrionales bacterium]